MKVIYSILMLILVSTLNQAQFKTKSVTKVFIKKNTSDTMNYERYVYNLNRYRDSDTSADVLTTQVAVNTITSKNENQDNSNIGSDTT
jgi:hypothetical protein